MIWYISKVFQTSSYGPVWPLNFSLEKTSSYIRITTKYILCQEFLVYSKAFWKATIYKLQVGDVFWTLNRSRFISFLQYSLVFSANFFTVKNIPILFIQTNRERAGSHFSSTVWVQDYLSSPTTQDSKGRPFWCLGIGGRGSGFTNWNEMLWFWY